MKNFWFIIIGIVIGFFTFYNWYLNTSTEDKSLSKKVTTPTYKNPIQKDTIIQTKRRKKDLNISSSLVTEESNNITEEEAHELINLLYLLGYISFGANKDNDKSTWKLTRRAYTIYYPWWKLILHELFPSFF